MQTRIQYFENELGKSEIWIDWTLKEFIHKRTYYVKYGDATNEEERFGPERFQMVQNKHYAEAKQLRMREH